MNDSPAFLMADASRLFRRIFDAQARSLGLTGQQWRVLVTIFRHEGINQGGAAELLEVEPITLSRMIDRLAEAGMIERRSDPDDRRAWRLYLTPAAHPLIERMRAIADGIMDDAFAGFTTDEQAALISLAGRFRANLSLRGEPSPADHLPLKGKAA